jgi:hypothetical protein
MNPYSPPAPPDAQFPVAPYPTGPSAYAAPAAGTVSELAVLFLQQTRPWVLLLSVLTFLSSGLMFLLGAGILVLGAAAAFATSDKFPVVLVGLFYLPLGLIGLYPGIKLWKYGSAIGQLLLSRSSADLEQALGQQKSFWKYSGIAAIVLLVLYIGLIGVTVAIGVAGALGKS